MAIEHVVGSGMAVGAAQDGAAQDGAVPAAKARVEHGSPGFPGQGGLLAACMAFIVAVVAVIVGLRPAWLRIIVAVLMSGRGRGVIRVAHLRAPSLAKLCLLRT